MFEASEPFAVQSSDFRLGGDSDVTLLPKQVPNQLIYASSASATDTYFYEKYRDFSKKMFLGDSRYFVADIDSDAVIGATFNGKIYPVPLLSQETVDSAIRKNPEKAMREYGNIFTTEGADEQIIRRAVITRNSRLRKPVLAGKKGRKFIFAIDPARTYDNSVMTIAELIDDKEVGYKLDIVNIVSFADVLKKKKTPIRTPQQIKEFKRALLDYNGIKAADYENIEAILLDDGSGGGGISAWADTLLEDWKDESGKNHKGLIDTNHEQFKDSKGSFPSAVDKLKLITPQRYRTALFTALRDMMNHDLITFPENYDGKGEMIFTEFDKKGEEKTVIHTLSEDEIMGLVQIDVAKEELVSIHETVNHSSGKISYALAPDKKNRMHDDRAYTIAMLAWYLQELRRENIKKEPELNIEDHMIFMSSGF